MQKLAKLLLKIMHWKIVGQLPDLKKYIIIVAPHTSNWDLVIGLICRFAVGVKINFLAKHQLFFFPLGQFLRLLGGTPVNRSRHDNKVAQVVDLFNAQDTLKLGLAPEGTRSVVTRWKEGFYHIAQQTGIPIVMIGMDYPSRELRIAEPLYPTGDMQADFAKIVAYFRTIHGRFPKVLPDYHPKEPE
ncbi:MAG: acyltransferase [Legionella sp.]|nr:MAG: acyltransferase [Legionella sp.]